MLDEIVKKDKKNSKADKSEKGNYKYYEEDVNKIMNGGENGKKIPR